MKEYIMTFYTGEYEVSHDLIYSTDIDAAIRQAGWLCKLWNTVLCEVYTNAEYVAEYGNR